MAGGKYQCTSPLYLVVITDDVQEYRHALSTISPALQFGKVLLCTVQLRSRSITFTLVITTQLIMWSLHLSNHWLQFILL